MNCMIFSSPLCLYILSVTRTFTHPSTRRVSSPIRVLPREEVLRFLANIIIEDTLVMVDLQEPGIPVPARSSHGVYACLGRKYEEDEEELNKETERKTAANGAGTRGCGKQQRACSSR